MASGTEKIFPALFRELNKKRLNGGCSEFAGVSISQSIQDCCRSAVLP